MLINRTDAVERSKLNHIDTIKTDASLGKRSRTRLMLLESAAELFDKQGYPKSSMRDIAAKAGIQAGSMFYHFKDKEELLFVLMERTMVNVIESQAYSLMHCSTPDARLRALIRTDVEAFISRDPGVSFHTLVHEWRHLGEAYANELNVLRGEYERVWLSVLDDCWQAQMFTVSPKIIRRLLHGALAWIPYWYQQGGEKSIDEIITDILQLFSSPSDTVREMDSC